MMLKKGSWQLALGILLLCVSVGLFSCEKDVCREVPDLTGIEVSIPIVRLEKQLPKIQSWQQAQQLLRENPVFADYFMHASQYPHDSILAKRFFRMLQSPAIDTLFMETEQVFGDLSSVQQDMEQAFRIINYHYPNIPTPRLSTVVTAFYNDLYISDSLIIAGLDYFLGEEATFRPDEHLYILKRFKKETLVPTIVNFVSNEFNKIDKQHSSLIADMINIGKSYYFTSQVMPCTPDSLIIGYSAEEMRLVRENQEIIWANLIENELLYETNDYMKNKFIGERPSVSEISEKCPGRVGAWVGWEIVKTYVDKNPEMTLKQLMEEDDAHKIFQESRYRPKNEK